MQAKAKKELTKTAEKSPMKKGAKKVGAVAAATAKNFGAAAKTAVVKMLRTKNAAVPAATKAPGAAKAVEKQSPEKHDILKPKAVAEKVKTMAEKTKAAAAKLVTAVSVPIKKKGTATEHAVKPTPIVKPVGKLAPAAAAEGKSVADLPAAAIKVKPASKVNVDDAVKVKGKVK